MQGKQRSQRQRARVEKKPERIITKAAKTNLKPCQSKWEKSFVSIS